MKKFLQTILPAVLLMTFLSGSALAQQKIATVDLRKLFENYYKTKQAQAIIQDRRNGFAKDEQTMNSDLKKDGDDYQQLLAKENDPAISADELDRRKQAAADKLKELQERKAALDQYDRTAQANLSEQIQRMHDKVLGDIEGQINVTAKARGYTLVFDTGAQSINSTPVLVYHANDNDLTDEVLKQLNAGAPIDTAAPAIMSPAPSLGRTNSL